MGEFLGYLGTVLHAAGRSRALDASLLAWVEAHPRALAIAIGVALLAGVSTLLGNSGVLLLNRIRGYRFWFSIALNAAALVLLYAVQSVATWLVGLVVAGPQGPSLYDVTVAVMLSTGPLAYGFLALIPFVGPGIARGLQVWSFLSLWVLSTAGYGRGLWAGLLIAGVGWGVMQVLAWAFSRPVTWLGDRFWQLMTGRPSLLTGHDILSGHPFMPLDHQGLAVEADRRS